MIHFYALFVFHIFCNSLCTFATTLFLVQLLLVIFRIPFGRIRAFFLFIPILKLPVDLFLYDFSTWVYNHQIDIFAIPTGTRRFLVQIGLQFSPWFSPIYCFIQLSALEQYTFGIADIVGYYVPNSLFFLFLPLFFLFSLLFFINNFLQTLRFLQKLDSFCWKKVERKQSNLEINREYMRGNVRVVSSFQYTGSPFITGFFSPTLYFPQEFLQSLDSKEYAAVLAHEIEHIRNKDLYLRLIMMIITTIFWWVPTKWLCKQIAYQQEIASDCNCRKYGVDPIDLSSSLYKSARDTFVGKTAIIGAFSNNFTEKRLSQLLAEKSPGKVRQVLSFLFLVLSLSTILLGKFWIF